MEITRLPSSTHENNTLRIAFINVNIRGRHADENAAVSSPDTIAMPAILPVLAVML